MENAHLRLGLLEYVRITEAEAAKSEDQRHPIIAWRAQAAEYMNAQPAQADGSRVALPTGALAAFTCFAYDLYIVDDNGGIDEEWLRRLKNVELFQGARHELFAEATCYRAGFTVKHEDEKDGNTRHAEFTARHKLTGQLLSVEAKSRQPSGRPSSLGRFVWYNLSNGVVTNFAVLSRLSVDTEFGLWLTVHTVH